MPSLEGLTEGQPTLDAINNATAQDAEEIVFPPVTREHILNCSYDSWFPKYRTVSIRSRIIPLTPDFVQYIRDDGIILADDDEDVSLPQNEDAEEEWSASSNTAGAPRRNQHLDEDDSDSDDGQPEADPRPPNERFPEIHRQIKSVIAELGGAVHPKLNWSAPKDAAWISPHQNTLRCTSPNDVYLLLKSSSFVSHDLEHAFDDTVTSSSDRPFSPVLVLRPFFAPNPALEFRCFVKHRALVGLCQRDWNHYPFLGALRPAIVSRVLDFFERRLRFTFPDGSFVFDVYVPVDADSRDELGKVRLVDVNPWAPRTDGLLFSWEELLDFKVPKPILGSLASEEQPSEVSGAETDEDEDEDVDELVPELRLVEKDNPAAFNFSTPQYSAHKLPKEVVDASMAGEGGLREFAQRWKEMTEAEGGGDVWENAPAEK
ncbi:cell cycle control protein cdc123 [Colletotrichum musicola]|uniref:Cell cycle control protein cdc123 n=1 Tax=Colletotrichum musicola TaxID=2175873 RepID=A0A8H6UA64_9PEZI|nr:cell cycle control protein cdc123 [Colletotrichum musicola]